MREEIKNKLREKYYNSNGDYNGYIDIMGIEWTKRMRDHYIPYYLTELDKEYYIENPGLFGWIMSKEEYDKRKMNIECEIEVLDEIIKEHESKV